MRYVLLVLLTFLVTCGKTNFGHTKLWIQHLRYSAEKDINEGTVIPLHIVLIYDKKNVEEFKKMSGHEFYKRLLDRGAAAMERDYQGDIQIFEYHVMPGGKIEHIDLNKHSEVVLDGVVFAQFQDKTFHKPLLDSGGVEVELNEQGIEQKSFEL